MFEGEEMNSVIRKWHRNQRGQAFIAVLGLLMIGGLTIFPLLAHMSTGAGAVQIHEQVAKSAYAADAGVELGIWNLKNAELAVPEGGQATLPLFTMNINTVNVTVDDIGAPKYKITAVATSDDGPSTTIEAYIFVTVGFFDNDFDVFEGNFQLGPGENYTGNIWAEGDAQLEVSGNLTGLVYAQGNVQLYDGAQITGDVFGEENVQLYDGAIIIGDVCAEGNVQLYPGAQITGDVYVQGDLQLDDGAIIDGDVYVGENVQLDPGAQITGTIYYSYEGCPLCEGSGEIRSWQIIN